MLFDSSVDVIGQANVESSFAILKNINAIGCRHPAKDLVAGAGFEPATFRL